MCNRQCYPPLLLILLCTFSVSGDLVIQQLNIGTSEQWTIRRIASFEYGGVNPEIFYFRCTSTVNDGTYLSWARTDAALTKTQQGVTGGVDLQMTTPVVADIGTYRCTDSSNSEYAEFILTEDVPATLVESDSLTYYVGDTAVINMYASALMELQDSNINWKFNNVELTSGQFSNNKTTLTIPNMQLSDGGDYKILVSVRDGMLETMSSTTTSVQVLGLPTIIEQPQNQSKVEWESVSFNCTGYAYGNNNLYITWHRRNEALPSNHSTINNHGNYTVTSVLTLHQLRSADAGQYYCNVSTTDGLYYSVSISADLVVSDNIRLSYSTNEDDNQILSEPILLIANSSEPFVIDCEGSASSYWTMGDSHVNVSFNNTDNPFQYITEETGFNRLNFSSFSMLLESTYSCVSSDLYSTVYISSGNPVVFAPVSQIIVEYITNTVLSVYVAGNNPAPTARNISWLYNGSTLPNEMYYMLQNENKDLIINNVSSSLVTGQYTVEVSTLQGISRTFINISYSDPPVVTVYPLTTTIREGDYATFTCNYTSALPVTVMWYHEDSATPLISSDGILNVTNARSEDRGTYHCVVKDIQDVYAVTKSVELTVNYAPTVNILTLINQHPVQTLLVNQTVDTSLQGQQFECQVDAHPTASLMWIFNYGDLPTGVIVNTTMKNNQSVLSLSWTRDLVYSDNGTYTCIGSNIIGNGSANLFINVYATPHLITIYSNDSSLSVNTSGNGQLVSPLSAVSITCVAYGLPPPSVIWIDSNGTQLMDTFTSKPCGMAQSTLVWNAAIYGAESVYCQVSNKNRDVMHKVVFADNEEEEVSSSSVEDLVESGESVAVRLKFNTARCDNTYLTNTFDTAVIATLRSVIMSLLSSCSIDGLSLNINKRGCENQSLLKSNASVYAITITTMSMNNTKQVYDSLGEWVLQNPVIPINDHYIQLNSNCTFLIQQNDSNLLTCSHSQSVTMPTESNTSSVSLPTLIPVPTPAVFLSLTRSVISKLSSPSIISPPTVMGETKDNQISIWIFIVVAMILTILLVVAIFFVVLCLCIMRMNVRSSSVNMSQMFSPMNTKIIMSCDDSTELNNMYEIN